MPRSDTRLAPAVRLAGLRHAWAHLVDLLTAEEIAPEDAKPLIDRIKLQMDAIQHRSRHL